MGDLSSLDAINLNQAKAEQEAYVNKRDGIPEEFSIKRFQLEVCDRVNSSDALLDLSESITQNPFSKDGMDAFRELVSHKDLTIYRDPNVSSEEEKKNFYGLSDKQLRRIRGDIGLIRLLIYTQSRIPNEYDAAIEKLDVSLKNEELQLQLERRVERTRLLVQFLKDTDTEDSELWNKSSAEVYDMVVKHVFGSNDFNEIAKHTPGKEIGRIKSIAFNIADRVRNTKKYAFEYSKNSSIFGDEIPIDPKTFVQRLLMPLRHIDPITGKEVTDDIRIDQENLIPTYQEIPGEISLKFSPYAITIYLDQEANDKIDGKASSFIGRKRSHFILENRDTNIIVINTSLAESGTLEHEKSHSYFELLRDHLDNITNDSMVDLIKYSDSVFDEKARQYMDDSFRNGYTHFLDEVAAQYVGGDDAYLENFYSLGGTPFLTAVSRQIRSATMKNWSTKINNLKGNVKPNLYTFDKRQREYLIELGDEFISGMTDEFRLTKHLVNKLVQEKSIYLENFVALYSGLSFEELLKLSGYSYDEIYKEESEVRERDTNNIRSKLSEILDLENSVYANLLTSSIEEVRTYFNLRESLSGKLKRINASQYGLFRRNSMYDLHEININDFRANFIEWDRVMKAKLQEGYKPKREDMMELVALLPKRFIRDISLGNLRKSLYDNLRQGDTHIAREDNTLWSEFATELTKLKYHFDIGTIDIPLDVLSLSRPRAVGFCCFLIRDMIVGNPQALTPELAIKIRGVMEGFLNNLDRYDKKNDASYIRRVIMDILGWSSIQSAQYNSVIRSIQNSRESLRDNKSFDLLKGIEIFENGIRFFPKYELQSADEFLYDWPNTSSFVTAERSNGKIIRVNPMLLIEPVSFLNSQVYRQEKGIVLDLNSSAKVIVKEYTEEGDILTREYYVIDNEYGRGYVYNGAYFPFSITLRGIEEINNLKKAEVE